MGLPQLLVELGFNRRQRCLALGTIVGRMAAPASERQTNRWLRTTTALGEMLDIDFGALSEMALYRISDQLLLNQQVLEEQLFERACSLFELQPTIAFYDLTNTHFEGQMKNMPEAKRGRSKQKRSDCPLLTLALLVDASGFVMKSRIFAGNVAESKTLTQMLEQLGADADAVVVMDRGIAVEDNISWLQEHGYRYVVMSRKKTRKFDAESARMRVNDSSTVSFYKETVTHSDDDGNDSQEAYLRCYSEARADKENGIINRFRKRYEAALEQLNAGLGAPKAKNQLEQVKRRIGRLQKQNARVAHHYQVEV